MRTYKSWLLSLLALLLTACTLTGLAPAAIPAVVSGNQAILVTAPANATATATPFQPLPPTPTYLPTATPLPPTPLPPSEAPKRQKDKTTKFPGPSEYSPIAIPPPVDRIKQPDGQVNILLMGSDQRRHSSGFRADTLVLLTLNPESKTVSLTSFPRDLYVYIPGWSMQRINTAHAHGGFETTQMAFAYNLGVWPDYYILINFWSFVRIIDELGGIKVDVEQGLGDHRDRYGYYYIPPGKTHMDGETALWYSRSRYSTNDFDRNRRQQEVLQALAERLISIDAIAKAGKLYDIYKENVTTDLNFSDIVPLLPLAAQLADTSRINHYYIGSKQVTGWITPTGAQVLLPDRDAVLKVMRQALNGR